MDQTSRTTGSHDEHAARSNNSEPNLKKRIRKLVCFHCKCNCCSVETALKVLKTLQIILALSNIGLIGFATDLFYYEYCAFTMHLIASFAYLNGYSVALLLPLCLKRNIILLNLIITSAMLLLAGLMFFFKILHEPEEQCIEARRVIERKYREPHNHYLIATSAWVIAVYETYTAINTAYIFAEWLLCLLAFIESCKSSVVVE